MVVNTVMSTQNESIWSLSCPPSLSTETQTIGWSLIILFLMSEITGKGLSSSKHEEETGTKLTITSNQPWNPQVFTLMYSCSSLGLRWWGLGPQWSCPARLLAISSQTMWWAGWSRNLEKVWNGLDIFILGMMLLTTIRSSRARPNWLQTNH